MNFFVLSLFLLPTFAFPTNPITAWFCVWFFIGCDDYAASLGDPIVHVPIEQDFPKTMNYRTRQQSPSNFGYYMAYWHTYPELMGYDRRGNGQPDGDSGWWTLISETGPDGRGSLLVQFPPLRNMVDVDSNKPDTGRGAVDGIYHPSVRPYLRGFNFDVLPVDPVVQFGADHGPRYHAEIPYIRSWEGHYLDYTGVPYTRYEFLIQRLVVWGNLPYPVFDSPPARRRPSKPVHTEL